MFTCGNLSIVPVLTDLDDRNSTQPLEELITGKDAAWVLTSSVIIFTMQTGFGLLESGCVKEKNEVNIMVKNALDVVFGGITYWAVGFGLSFGANTGTNPFVGVGCFFLDAREQNMGYIYAVFIFQLSFATTSTTIVSGAMAERTRLHAYIVFSMLNTVIYCIPAHWIWADGGFLHTLGCMDAAGCGPVHLIGGATGLVATLMLGPRSHIKENPNSTFVPSPLKTILGMLMLWWAWLRFNSGSIFVVSVDAQWKLAVRAAVNTILSSMAGGIVGVIISVLLSLKLRRSRYDVSVIINGVLGSLVAITGICTFCRPWESLCIGAIAAVLTAATEGATSALKIDDPVGVIPVHLTCGIWGLLSIGLFVEEGQARLPGGGGLFKTGHWYMLGVQTLAATSMLVWTVLTSYLLLKVIDLTIGLRLSAEDEVKGCDVIEHGIQGGSYSRSMGDSYHGDGIGAVRETDVDGDDRPDNDQSAHSARCMAFFKDFLAACDRHDLQIEFRRSGQNGVTMDVRLVPDPADDIQIPRDHTEAQNGTSRQNEANGSVGLATISVDSGIDTRL